VNSAHPAVSFQRQTSLATPADLQKTVSFFETIVQRGTAYGNSSELSTIADDGFRSIRDVISGKTSIAGVTIEDPSLIKFLAFPRIWGPLCKIIDCGLEPLPFPWPSCDPAVCDPVESGGCDFGLCGPIGENGPIFPIDPVVDPIDPDFAIERIKNWATGRSPLELSANPQLELKDLKELVSGLGNLAVSWKFSSAASSNEMAVRSRSGDGNLGKRKITKQDVKDVLEIILLLATIIATL
jgi:hypothetical protein